MAASATTNGGTTTLRIELSDVPETPTFVVAIDGDTGYFVVEAADTNEDGIYEIELQLEVDVDLSKLTVRLAPIDANGNVGEYQVVEYDVVKSGVGTVKVTLTFEQEADLDLHVIEPNETEIFYGAPESRSGGKLDVDTNAQCEIDGLQTENIYWPEDSAPSGTYSVWVKHFDDCGVDEDVEYTVTIHNGPSTEAYHGVFEPGTMDEKRLVARFVH